MFMVGRKCTLIFFLTVLIFMCSSSAGECTCVCEVFFGAADLHVDELLVY